MKNNFNNPIYNKINKNRKKFTTDTDNQINNVSDYDYCQAPGPGLDQPGP